VQQQWAIGDWLVDGKRHYGDGLYKRAASILGYQEQSMKQFKILADSFGLKFRRLNLSWAHHQEVASLKIIKEESGGKLYLSDETDYEKVVEMLTAAEKDSQSVRDLREVVRLHKEAQQRQIQLANAPEKYHGMSPQSTRATLSTKRFASISQRLPVS
jgi:hypothetical protein